MKRVLIVCDVFRWAQHRHALGVQKYAPDWCKVEVIDLTGYGQMVPDQLAAFDVVHVLYLGSATRRQGIRRLTSMLASHAWMHPELKENNWYTRGVTQGRCRGVAEKALVNLDAVVCRNGELEKFARQYVKAKFIPVGVDTDVFCPRPRREKGNFVVGWCGQIGGKTSFKGYAEVMQPLRRLLGGRYEFHANTLDATQARDAEAMAAWYNTLDVFLSTSCAEGTPNPPFEAAACGVPVIATSVGLIRHWDMLGKMGLLVPSYYNEGGAERVIGHIARRLAWLERSRHSRRYCSVNLLESIRERFDYRIVAPQVLEFICNG